MFLKSISLTNILSFGDQTTHIELRPLNILIGHNGSGKSNLIECIGLLKAIPDNTFKTKNQPDSLYDFKWKGASWLDLMSIEASLNYESGTLNYQIEFDSEAGFYLYKEVILKTEKDKNHPKNLYSNTDKKILLYSRNEKEIQELDYESWNISATESVLSQLKDWKNYPEITLLSRDFQKVRIYRDWPTQKNAPLRMPQRSDMPNDFLLEDASNFGLILNKLRLNLEVKRKSVNYIRNIYPGAEDFEVLVEANRVQVFIQEGNFSIPATRLSDGTLRFLCLLAILCDPNPPPLICIEEPELGLHPDMMPVIADLLRDASTRTQLIVTTHSDLLVEQFSDEPESILTFEKHGDQSSVKRLDTQELADWLEKYSLGQLRQRGFIEGNRW